MADQDQSERVWDIIEHVGVGMLTTRFSGGFRARPLEARADREAGIIWFLTDARSAKDHEIGAEPDVGLVFIDPGKKAYLSITARAQIRRDTPQAQKIWKTTDKMWWDGPEDPNLRVLRVDPQCAELWDGPSSTAVEAYEFVKARITGEKPNLGENRKVTVKL
jgi:general stress protein 26